MVSRSCFCGSAGETLAVGERSASVLTDEELRTEAQLRSFVMTVGAALRRTGDSSSAAANGNAGLRFGGEAAAGASS